MNPCRGATPAAALAMLLCLFAAACGDDTRRPQLALEPESDQPTDLPGFRRWSEGIGLGARPVGGAAYSNLAALGFDSVLCVEAAPPDVAAIERSGLRCFHLPLGWSEISSDQVRAIARVVLSTERGVFVYCDTGQIRGPVVATLARRCRGLSVDTALRDLRQCGVGNEHARLVRAIVAYKPLQSSELDAVPLPPARVKLSATRAQMIVVDTLWRKLEAARTSRLALELAAVFEESSEDVRASLPLLSRDLTQAQMAATLLSSALQSKDSARVQRAYVRLKAACMTCHKQHRQ